MWGVWLTRLPKWDFYSTYGVTPALAARGELYNYVYYLFTVLYAMTEWSSATNKETKECQPDQPCDVAFFLLGS